MPAARCTDTDQGVRPPPSSAHLICAGFMALVTHALVAERQRKQHQHEGGKAGRVAPDGAPVVQPTDDVVVGDQSCGPEADQHPEAIGGKGDQALG